MYPLVSESKVADLTTPVLICVEKVSLETNFISPFILADIFLLLLTSINNFEFNCEFFSLNLSKFSPSASI